MPRRDDLTAKFVRSILDYDPITGIFRWKPRENPYWWNGKFAGKIAGAPDKRGYLKIQIGKRKCTAGRLAWLVMTGSWPMRDVDHENRNKLDNKWKNLREATPTENNHNKPIKNWAKMAGAHWHWPTKKWISSITKDKVKHYLGLFDTPEKAHEAYCAAAKRLYGKHASTK